MNKPNPKHNNFKVPPRLNSEGYNKVNGLDPEKQRNIPTNLLEKKEEEKRNELNINAPSFTPKSQNITQFQYEQKNQNYGYQNQTYNNPNNMNNYNYMNMYNTSQPPYMNMNYQASNPMFNSFTNYQNMPPQMVNQQNYFHKNMFNNQFPNPMHPHQPVYKKASGQKWPINQTYNPKKAQYFNNNNNNNTSTTKNSFAAPQANATATSSQKIPLKLNASNPAYIPKSRRNIIEPSKTNNGNMNMNNTEEKFELDINSPGYMPTNLNLKKMEEQIQKQKETNEKLKKEDNNKTKNEKSKENEKDKNETQTPPKKEAPKEQPREKPKQEEKKAEPNKPPSKLKDLLFSKVKIEPKKQNKEKTKKVENNIEYNNINKTRKEKDLINKKIDLINEKEKKNKEAEKRQKEMEEKRQKEEERKRKIEEEKRRKEEEEKRRKEEEEKIRKEEEEKRRKEEEKRRKEEEKRRKEEEEKRRKEEEEKKKREEERKKQIELEEKRKKEEAERKIKEEQKRKEEELKKEEERKRKEEEEKNKVIEKKYFIVFKNKKSEKKEYKYTFEYIMQFKKWKIANEEELLTDKTKEHFKGFNEVEKDGGKPKKRDNQKVPYYKNKSNGPNYAKIQVTKEEPNPVTPVPENSMEQWARKDMTKEIKAAEEFKQKLEETIKDDPIKRNLRNYLNMLTKDNYEKTKKEIFNVIKDSVDYQCKFLDVLFQKAVFERAFVEIYAKLCKELDKDLPQKSQPKEQKEGEKKQKPTSEMRKKLLDKCREIFQIEHNEKFDEYIKVKDPDEREAKLKNFVLGNVYFITELIKIKILSKKIAPVCIKNLFKRYENAEGDQKLKLINIEAIVIFTDKFGTLVHSQEKKIASEDAIKFKQSIDEIFQKLEKVKDEKDFPGYIKYRIINLIEKRKNNYQKSKLEEYRNAKSKKEVEQELESQDIITQDNINDKIKKGLSDYKEFVEEEGTSEKYPWKETTYLYDKKEKSLDDILEGYIVSCGDFIEKESNIKYAKDYIKELIEYYGDKINKKEKKELKNRLLKLLDFVRDCAIDIPKIYDIYSYIIYIFLDNNIMEIGELEEIIKEEDAIDDDYKIISDIFKMTYEYYKKEDFKEEVAKFNFVKNHSQLFEWLYKEDEEE